MKKSTSIILCLIGLIWLIMISSFTYFFWGGLNIQGELLITLMGFPGIILMIIGLVKLIASLFGKKS